MMEQSGLLKPTELGTNMKLLLTILSGLCCVSFAYQWYLGQQIPAWHALVWCMSVFLQQLREYLES